MGLLLPLKTTALYKQSNLAAAWRVNNRTERFCSMTSTLTYLPVADIKHCLLYGQAIAAVFSSCAEGNN